MMGLVIASVLSESFTINSDKSTDARTVPPVYILHSYTIPYTGPLLFNLAAELIFFLAHFVSAIFLIFQCIHDTVKMQETNIPKYKIKTTVSCPAISRGLSARKTR